MGTEQLKKVDNKSAPRISLEDVLLQRIKDIPASSLVKAKDYKPNKNVPKDYRDSIEDLARRQQISHRDTLLKIVGFLATASFLLLTVVVIGQMVVRYFKPEYTGISDAVVQIIAVSVFGQVLTVMGGLSYHLWKKNQ